MEAWYRSMKKSLVTLPPALIGVWVFFSIIITAGLASLVNADSLITGAIAGGVVAFRLSKNRRPPKDA